MNKVKEFFKKLAAQIKNTAWIQPILIVIVIFVILFSLNPLTNAIKKGWTSLTSVNKMETISYQEYVEKVNNAQDGEKFVVVFTTKGDETCADLFDSMNEFLKGSTYKNGDFKVYNVSLATKSAKAKINDRKYVKKILKLIFIPKDIQEAVLNGTQDVRLSLKKLVNL